MRLIDLSKQGGMDSFIELYRINNGYIRALREIRS